MSEQIPIYQLGIYADKYPVTVTEYRSFNPSYVNPWKDVIDNPNIPVTRITFQNAYVYAAFYGKRLPTTQEWISCATGMMLDTDSYNGDFQAFGRKRRFPWGDEEDPRRCNCADMGIGHPTPVNYFDGKCESPFRLSDMMGNVWEITDTYFEESMTGRQMKEGGNRTIIGGYFGNSLLSGGFVGEDVMKMDMLLEDAGSKIIGFRCVQDFNRSALIKYAEEIQKAYYVWCYQLGGLVPGKDYLICDSCDKKIDPRKGLALGSDNYSISFYCPDCFVRLASELLRLGPDDGHNIILYGLALGFMVAYMRGDTKGGDYVYKSGGLEQYAKICRLQSIRPSSQYDGQKLLEDLTS